MQQHFNQNNFKITYTANLLNCPSACYALTPNVYIPTQAVKLDANKRPDQRSRECVVDPYCWWYGFAVPVPKRNQRVGRLCVHITDTIWVRQKLDWLKAILAAQMVSLRRQNDDIGTTDNLLMQISPGTEELQLLSLQYFDISKLQSSAQDHWRNRTAHCEVFQ